MPLDNAFALDLIAEFLERWPGHRRDALDDASALTEIANVVRRTGRRVGPEVIEGEFVEVVDSGRALSPDELEDLVCSRDWNDDDLEFEAWREGEDVTEGDEMDAAWEEGR